MRRPLVAGLMLACLLAAADATACTILTPGPFELDADAPHGTAPRPARIAEVRIVRGICHDLGILTLRLRGAWADAYGYRLAVADGAAPPGLRFMDRPYASEDNELKLVWVDSDAELGRTFHFVLAIAVVDEAGRQSQVRGVEITIGAHRRRPPRPRRRSIPPLVWFGGFVALFGMGAVAGYLRRPRIGSD